MFSLSPLFSEHWSSSVDGAAYLQRCLETLPQGCRWIITNHSTNTAWRLEQPSWQWANRQTEPQQIRDDFKKKNYQKWVIQAAPSRLKIKIKAAKKLWKITKEVMEKWFCCISFYFALDSWELLPLSSRGSVEKDWLAANAVQGSEFSSDNPQANSHRQQKCSESQTKADISKSRFQRAQVKKKIKTSLSKTTSDGSLQRHREQSDRMWQRLKATVGTRLRCAHKKEGKLNQDTK